MPDIVNVGIGVQGYLRPKKSTGGTTLNSTVCRDGAVALVCDTACRRGDGFKANGHSVSVGVDQCAPIHDKGHMTFPEDQIVTLIGLCHRCADDLLLVAVARTGDATGQKSGLDKAGTINAPPAVAAPQVGRAQKMGGYGDRIRSDIGYLREVGQRYKTSLSLREFAKPVRDTQLACKAQRHHVGRFEIRPRVDMCGGRADLVGRQGHVAKRG